MIEPKWIEKDLVLTIHKIQIGRFGGLNGVRSEKLLESALARLKHYYAFNFTESRLIPKLACKYMIGIIQNHPFLDGNKRTGLISMHLFLHLHNIQWKISEEMQYIQVMALASGRISKNEFTEWVLSTID